MRRIGEPLPKTIIYGVTQGSGSGSYDGLLHMKMPYGMFLVGYAKNRGSHQRTECSVGSMTIEPSHATGGRLDVQSWPSACSLQMEIIKLIRRRILTIISMQAGSEVIGIRGEPSIWGSAGLQFHF